MNVLFVALPRIDDYHRRGLYTDFIRTMVNHGHHVTVLTAFEKRDRESGIHIEDHSDGNVEYIYAKTNNVTKNIRLISKGLGILALGPQYKACVKKYDTRKFDLVVCTTPSITFEKTVSYIKKRDNARVVLLLKDMWPYDLVFDNVLTKKGLKGLAYKYLEAIAVKLFDEADVIGCMTPKNKEFLEAVYNEGKPLEKATIIPNSIEPYSLNFSREDLIKLRKSYQLPEGKKIFVYGGNLGVAQGADYIIESVAATAMKFKNSFVLIVGNGTEAKKIQEALKDFENVKCIPALPHDEYEKLVYACDVGLVYLNWNCHTPNSPSRILQYMQSGLPVICATDDTTDIGVIAEQNGFGLSCCSNDVESFLKCVEKMLNDDVRISMGRRSRLFLETEYSAEKTYQLIFCN